MLELTGTFETVGSNGERYALYEYTEYIPAGTFGDPNAMVEGLKEFRTSEGLHVNRVGKGQYKILQTGLSLHSNSPDAP